MTLVRHVELDAVVRGEKALDVFENVLRWERYPELAPHVRSATVHSNFPETVGSSSWELRFRSGLLRWTEREHFFPDRLEIAFEQSDGDFDAYAGSWRFRQDGDDVAVRFRVGFDFGIPSLEGILDPVAQRVVEETVTSVLAGLFPRTDLVGRP